MGFVRYAEREQRDERIRELSAQGLSVRKVAALVGCSHAVVWEVANPEKQRAANARRRAHNTSREGLDRRNERRRRATE